MKYVAAKCTSFVILILNIIGAAHDNLREEERQLKKIFARYKKEVTGFNDLASNLLQCRQQLHDLDAHRVSLVKERYSQFFAAYQNEVIVQSV